MRHPEHVNIAIRRTVRRDRLDLTNVHPIPYDGKRHTKLPLLKTELFYPEDPTIQELQLLSSLIHEHTRQPLTFIVRQQQTMAANRGLRFGPITGTYIITHLAIELLGATPYPIQWGMNKCPSRPTTMPEIFLGQNLIPFQADPDHLAAMIQEQTGPVHYHIAIQDYFDSAWIAFAIYDGGAPAADNYVQLSLTMREL